MAVGKEEVKLNVVLLLELQHILVPKEKSVQLSFSGIARIWLVETVDVVIMEWYAQL